MGFGLLCFVVYWPSGFLIWFYGLFPDFWCLLMLLIWNLGFPFAVDVGNTGLLGSGLLISGLLILVLFDFCG